MERSRGSRQPNEASDEQLVSDFLKSGDVSSFDELYSRYRGPILRYLAGVCAAEAEDLTSACFEIFALNPEKYDPEKAPFKHWLFTVASNLGSSYMSRVKRRMVQLGNDAIGSNSYSGYGIDRPKVSESTLMTSYCWGKLSEKTRRVVYLIVIEGYTIEETAGILNLKPGTVGAIKFRGLAKLKICWDGLDM